jgi:acyl dehydratase
MEIAMTLMAEPQPLPVFSTPAIALEQLRAFAESARDPNPIHLDGYAAQNAGLPGVIAHGMLVASYLSEYAEFIRESRLGEEYYLASFQVKFKGMTRLGDSLVLKGTAKEQSGQTLLSLEAVGSDGEVKSVANAVLKSKGALL